MEYLSVTAFSLYKNAQQFNPMAVESHEGTFVYGKYEGISAG